MVDHIVDASERRGRIDIRTGVGRRRRWSDEVKGQVVAKSYEPGVVVSKVARRHDITPQHLFGWRKAASDWPSGPSGHGAADVRSGRDRAWRGRCS